MNAGKTVRAVAGVLLLGLGLGLAVPSPYRQRRYLLDAGGCQIETDVVERKSGETHGAVVLFHGISANKKIMSYLARGFAEAGLRVYAPDFPGHGHTPGPFSPARAEQCGEAFVRDLLARGAIGRGRTILAGHSMGGAVAVRIAPRVPVAGVIAISPAPMRAAHGAEPEMLLFTNPPRLVANSLVMSGQFEPESMRANAADLLASGSDGGSEYLQIANATHVGMLFNSATVRAAQHWSTRVLKLPGAANLPSHRPLIGALVGFVAILLIAGPFLRECMSKSKEEPKSEPVGLWRVLLEFAAGSMLIVAVLRYWNPLKVVGLFEGDYLAGFVLLLGGALVALHWRSLTAVFGGSSRGIFSGAFAALVLLLLGTGWFELTFYEAWLTTEKWERFPFLLIALLPYHLVEERLISGLSLSSRWKRLAAGMTLRFIGWGALMGGVLLLHSGEILIGLLAPYLVIFNVVQRSGMDLVHMESGSTAATALFGAILAAGFFLVIFPLTGGSLT